MFSHINSFKFKEVALNFAKEDKTCNIKMSRDSFDAEIEIWVGPSASMATQPSSSSQSIEKKTYQK